ncbi:solute carrier family 15 member 4-like [Littorina saxatilis]|uniref:Solute carrier family 15 member 4 n=1 Tax=Littorina saxatilis TaxID=31220 RepID=A0AAN9GKT8_9CAEN
MSDMDATHEKRPLLDEGGSGSLSTNRSISEQARENGAGPAIASGLKISTHYKPKPVSEMSPQKLMVVLCILSTELCERLAYYSVVANLVLFCTSRLDFSSNDAATISLVFSGTTYLMPIIGGYIADAHIGMYNAIYGFALIYLLGLFLLPCSAIDYDQLFDDDQYGLSVTGRRTFYMVGLVLVSIGTGGIKANVGPFGAQQVQDLGPKAIQTFFNWFYWFVNAGALIAYVGVAAVQQNVSFAWGFFIPFLSMMLAIFFLLLSRKNYRYRTIKGSMMADSFVMCWQGCKRSFNRVPGAVSFFDKARNSYGGSFDDSTVDGVISVVRLLPIFAFVIMYWTIYSQMQSTFFIQGERMDLHIGGTQVPVAMLNAFNTIAIMLLIPCLDRVIYPSFQRINRPLSHLHRIGTGMILAALSMIAAAVVEIERKKHLGFEQVVGDETFYASNVTVFLQIPQFALVGASEAFTSISGLEFAYTQSPTSMQGVMMGVFMATSGLGSYFATALLKIVGVATADDPWFPDEINDGHAEYLFYLLSAMMGIFFLAFLVAAKFYKYKTVEADISIDQEHSSDESPPAQSRETNRENSDVTGF